MRLEWIFFSILIFLLFLLELMYLYHKIWCIYTSLRCMISHISDDDTSYVRGEEIFVATAGDGGGR
jgi:hypothetical protein